MRDPYDCIITTLPSGMRCYVQHDPTSRHCVLDLVVWAGGLEDPEGKEGLAHLYEHVVFAGTERYPTQMALNGPIESIGGDLNATTNAVRTHFYTVVPTQHAKLAAGILLDMVFRPLLTKEALAHEQGVIEAEIDRNESRMPSATLVEATRHMMGERYARRTWTLGWRETLARISVDDLRAWQERFFQPHQMALIATGNLTDMGGDPASWFDRQLTLLGCMDSAPSERIIYRPDTMQDVEARIFDVPDPPTRHPILDLMGNFHDGKGTTDLFVRHDAAASVIRNILASRGMTSLLQRELRDRLGWIYTANASKNFLSSYVGGWGVSVEMKRDGNLVAVLQAVQTLLVDTLMFSDAEVALAKQAILGEDALRFESPRNAHRWILDSLADEERVVSNAEWLERINSVDPAFVRDVVAQRFAPERMVIIQQIP